MMEREPRVQPRACQHQVWIPLSKIDNSANRSSRPADNGGKGNENHVESAEGIRGNADSSRNDDEENLANADNHNDLYNVLE